MEMSYLTTSSVLNMAENTEATDQRDFFFKERESKQGWEEGQRDKERENLEQALCPAKNPTWGSISQP